MKSILFHYVETGARIRKATEIKHLIQQIFHDRKRRFHKVDFIFCSDDFLLKINREFLSRNYYTDIITFSLNPSGQPVIGEVYISVERIKENAGIYKVSVEEERLRVIFHGALHLCGFGDKTSSEKKRMTELENLYLKKFYVSRNTVS